MSSYRKNPLFASALTLCALLALGELWCTYYFYRASRDAAVRLGQRETDLRGMPDLTPAPTRAVAAAIEADLARARHALDAMQAELKGRGPAAQRMRTAKVPAARTDAYFDLATFVEKMRELARKQEVDIRPEAARFGFSNYANEGPDADRIEWVFHQRLIAQYLVEALLEARPRALLSIKRERTWTKAEREARDAALAAAAAGGAPVEPSADSSFSSSPAGPDALEMDPRLSARVPGYIDTTAFRLVFSGQTASLRAFLNRLAGFELPVLVREVEVEPATGDETTAAPAAEESVAPEPEPEPAADSVVLTAPAPAPKAAAKKSGTQVSSIAPIVTKPFSKFTVTVEFIDIVPPANSADPAAAPTGPTT